MSAPVIVVQNLGKLYRRGQKRPQYRLRDTLHHFATAPLRTMGWRRIGAAPPGEEDFWALREVSFEVRAGEVTGVIGRNGAGKSTLLKLLSRITQPTTGYAEVRGRVGSLLEVGTGFHPELTGRENVFVSGAILGMPRKEILRKFDEIVDFADIGKFLDTPVKHYSSGMMVRLGFSVAAHLEPEILIVDEVLAVGDAEFQNKCIDKVATIAAAGLAVLLVSHNATSVKRLCTHAIWLDQGRLVANGKPGEILQSYATQTGTKLEISDEEKA
jgi:lipopolysaccharide transport system ATP-binding protein